MKKLESLTMEKLDMALCARQIAIEQVFNPTLKQAVSAIEIDCRKGCSACCNQLVPATILEGAAISTYLYSFNRTMPETLLEYLKILRQINCNAIEWFNKHLPCLFLENNLCTIYPIRPWACRSYFVGKGFKEKCTRIERNDDDKVLIISATELDIAWTRGERDTHWTLGLPFGMFPYPLAILLGDVLIKQGPITFEKVCKDIGFDPSKKLVFVEGFTGSDNAAFKKHVTDILEKDKNGKEI